MAPIQEKKGQPTWLAKRMPDLRSIGRELRSIPPAEVDAASNIESAIEIVARHLGFIDPAIRTITVDTPIGLVAIHRRDFFHIVEKRPEARERYVLFALDTLTGPLEVWKVEYDNHSFRLAFIGAYEAKRQMLVVVDIQTEKLLWNFMHTDTKSLNKHRHGKLLYKRYTLL